MSRFPLLPASLLGLVLLAAGAIAVLTAPAMAIAADTSSRRTPEPSSALLASGAYSGLLNVTEQSGADIADATRCGVELNGIRIDAATGEVLDARSLTAAQVRSALGAAG